MRCICGQYIKDRLRRSGLLTRKIGSLIDTRPTATATTPIICEISPIINSMGEELERMHPRIFSNVSRQLYQRSFGELTEADTAPLLLSAVAKDLFKNNDVTWGKIISLFAVAGGLSVDIVRQGHHEFLQPLIDATTNIVTDELAPWLQEQNGWCGLHEHIRPIASEHITFLGWLTILIVFMMVVHFVTSLLKIIGLRMVALIY